MVAITVNGVNREIQSPDDTPLLYILRNDLELTGPQFGCGLSQCGACSVLVEGKEVRSCVMPLSAVADKEITTLEGLPEEMRQTIAKAFVLEGGVQCGFCIPGILVRAAPLLLKGRTGDRAEP